MSETLGGTFSKEVPKKAQDIKPLLSVNDLREWWISKYFDLPICCLFLRGPRTLTSSNQQTAPCQTYLVLET